MLREALCSKSKYSFGYTIRLATMGVTLAVTSSPTQQICLCGSELMRREVVIRLVVIVVS